MAAAIGQFVGKRIFKEKLENKYGLEDVYFEQVPATRLDGRPNGKFKKVRKALPPGLSEHDAQILTKVKRRAYRLDMAFGSFMGLKVGWGSVIGIVPFAGDAVDALLGLMVIRTAKQIEGGLPVNIKMTMYFWLVLDLIVGLIPFIGDVFDCVILASTRNAKMLEDHLRAKGKKNLRASNLPIPDVDPSDPNEFDRFNAEQATTSGATRRANNHPPQESGVAGTEPRPSRPAEARVRDDGQGRSGGGFFGFGGKKKSRPADVEMGR
ncbi:hypothetical protein F4780DRAFT_777031 [Xylariomycetidae sp. FL0641]|nr:hypothetical protein F4780DRAFT_777031 [Xylariomycetidae sp. FL0641]